MTGRRYQVYDVFTDKALAGNPLAVVHDAEGLDTAAMQKIAGEFNLSETIFVSPASDKHHTASVRIFTPRIELPFAGHPTVGCAVALFEAREAETGSAGIVVLEEKIGPVRCAVSRRKGQAAFAEFDLARLPEPVRLSTEPAMIAAALGLDPKEIGFENHRPSLWTAGVPYLLVPVKNLDAARRAWTETAPWDEVAPEVGGMTPSAYVYCRETTGEDSAFHARMFAPKDGIPEDPATGSAVAAFSGAIVHFDEPLDGQHAYLVEQGIEMGRPSFIRLEVDIEAGRMTGGRIGGHAVKVAEGTLFA